MSQNYLFIGGPIDGEWRTFEEDREWFEMAVMPPQPVLSLAELDKLLPPPQIETVVYERFPWPDGRHIYNFYVTSGMNRHNVFEALVRGYRQPRKIKS